MFVEFIKQKRALVHCFFWFSAPGWRWARFAQLSRSISPLLPFTHALTVFYSLSRFVAVLDPPLPS
jgi:hypothetical protein